MPKSAARKIVLVLVLSLLTAPWASAAGLMTGGSSPKKGFLAQAWSFVVSLWSDEGCHIDPNGQCSQVAVDSGCHIDPDGRCLPAAQSSWSDTGCDIDPNGGNCQQ